MTTLIVVCAKYLIVLPVLLGLYSLYRAPREVRLRRALIVLASLALTYVLGRLAAYIYFDPRPFVAEGVAPLIPHAADNGFPSDHTLLAAGLAAAALFYDRGIALWLWVLAVVIGVARIFALVHHPIDISASMLIALVAASVVEILAKRIVPLDGEIDGDVVRHV